MTSLTLQAPAKINLTLDILRHREDGYHELCMVMQSVSLCDRIRLDFGSPGGIRAESGLRFLPNDKSNLAVAAALAFRQATGGRWQDLLISLQKRIPVCAGTAGGSSDAAAVLRALNQWAGEPLSPPELARTGEQVGSDVPYCVLGGTALAEGRGERLTALHSLPACWVVVCKPEFSVSTPELFAQIDRVKLRRRPDTTGMLEALAQGDLAGAARRMYNVFEDVLPERRYSTVASIKNTLIQCGALGATMSGTGPTAFGLFDQEESARQAWKTLSGEYRDTFLAHTV